jgi:hypothetical protein
VSGVLKNQWRVSVFIDYPGLGNLGPFDQSTGGAGESAEKKYREGGARDQSVLGGARMRSNVTVERLFRGERDGPIFKRLDNARGAQMVVNKQPRDEDGNDVGEPIIYRGKVKSVTGPDTDSNDDDGEAKLSIEQSTAGSLG